jgi:hypothetical protein
VAIEACPIAFESVAETYEVAPSLYYVSDEYLSKRRTAASADRRPTNHAPHMRNPSLAHGSAIEPLLP